MNANGLSDDQMQMIARELNNSETAFLFPPDHDDCDSIIRYFTPKTEVPTCGHATIAALYAKAIEKNLDSSVVRLKTCIGVLPCEIIKKNNDYQIIMTQGKFELHPAFDDLTSLKLLTYLGLERADLDERCPIQIASTGHSKVMIGIKSRRKLNSITPNFEALKELSGKIGCNGYFVFTFDSDKNDVLTYGRMFAPAIGISEDPVTGNAHGPLGGYLIQNKILETKEHYFEFNGKQGEALKRLGTITVRVKIENGKPSVIQIKGDAAAIFRAEIMLQ